MVISLARGKHHWRVAGQPRSCMYMLEVAASMMAVIRDGGSSREPMADDPCEQRNLISALRAGLCW